MPATSYDRHEPQLNGSTPVQANDDPLSPVDDRDLSDVDMHRILSSDTPTPSNKAVQPTVSFASTTGLMDAYTSDHAAKRDSLNSSTSTASPLHETFTRTNGSAEGGYEAPASVYQRHGSVDDGYKTGWAAHASTEHLNPNAQGGYDHNRRAAGGVSFANGVGDASRSGQHDDADEARQVQQNLERWAAAEKQRRKAARTSRSSFLGPPESGGLARRLTFGRKASGSSEPLSADSPGATTTTTTTTTGDKRASALLRKSSTGASLSSNESGASESSRRSPDPSSQQQHQRQARDQSNLNGTPTRRLSSGVALDGAPQLEDVPENDAAVLSSTRDRKGKHRAVDQSEQSDTWGRSDSGGTEEGSPFADPSEAAEQRFQKRRSLKPTAARPIVTPGRAPSIRRTPVGTPQIIATDVDATPSQRRASRADNPFLSASEAVQAAENGGHYLPRKGDGAIGLPPISRATTSDSIASTTSTVTNTQPSARFSMSSSKFREVGLDDAEGEEDENVPAHELARRRQLRRVMTRENDEDDDEEDDGGSGGGDAARRRRRRREAEEDRRRVREGKGRQPWWTEWLCGCGRVVDDDNEQTGKTGPE